MARFLLLACVLPVASSFMPTLASSIPARSASLEPLCAEACDGAALRDTCDAFDRRASLRRALGGAMALAAPRPAIAFGFGDLKTKPDQTKSGSIPDQDTVRKSVDERGIFAASLPSSLTHARSRRLPLANRYKAISSAKENIKDPKAKAAYVKNICDLGILGPSILAYYFCK